MKAHHPAWFVVLLTLLLAAAVGLWLTSDWAYKPSGRAARQDVDQRPLTTARAVAALASNMEERALAQEALRLADHEVDLAFATALRDAANGNAATPVNQDLETRLQRTQASVAQDEAAVARLTKALAAANQAAQPEMQQQLALTQAQLELDRDELDDAREDLARAGGDVRSRIQRLLDEHNAQHNADTVGSAAVPLRPLRHLSSQIGFVSALWSEQQQLQQAAQQAGGKAQALSQRHNQLEAQASAGQAEAGAQVSDLARLKRMSNRQRSLAELDRRIQDEQQLRDLYGRWEAIVNRRLHIGLHAGLTSIFLILLIALTVFLLDRLVDRSFAHASIERRRLRTLRMVLRMAAQVTGVVLVLLVIFGPPNQLSTFLGLLSAGLAVILKDFIVAFFGWFVLMGRNGIRVGDWVEIEGVRGEVIEIGLLRTVLLETDNWTDAGHPTGRKVGFVNSYAVEGHYFNFSTSGQWLWDELRVVIPGSENPYLLAEQIQKIVSAETAANEPLAAEEWRRLHHESGQEFSAATTVNLRPTETGNELTVRYVARAQERYQLRSRLYQMVVKFLHEQRHPAKTPLPQPATESS